MVVCLRVLGHLWQSILEFWELMVECLGVLGGSKVKCLGILGDLQSSVLDLWGI